jgi:anionic cell wall polymer biosynthesis LytR-Cps2A-Psr (LCP) family protein
MSKKAIAIIAVVVVVAIILCIAVVAVGYYVLNTPLGPSLALDTQIPAPTAESVPGPTAGEMPEADQPTPEPAEHCGEKGPVNIIVMGVDSPFGDGYKGPLAIRLVYVDFSRKTAVIFSFPRDLWVPVKGLESLGIDHERLGRLYLIARNNAGFSETDATRLVAQTLADQFGAYSDHYITGKMSTLVDIIDAVDGITVPVPVAHDATPWGMHYFPAGPYHMSGLLAMEYAVTPNLAGQWDGWDRQSLVLYTLFQKVLSPETLPKLPELIPLFLQVAVTDLSLQQMLNLVCISQEIPRDRMLFAEVGPEDVTFGPDGVQYPNTEAIREKVLQHLAPNSP